MQVVFIQLLFTYSKTQLRYLRFLAITKYSFYNKLFAGWNQNGFQRYYNFICKKPVIFLPLNLFTVMQVMKQYSRRQSKINQTRKQYYGKFNIQL